MLKFLCFFRNPLTTVSISDRSILDAIASLVHRIRKSLDASIKSVRWNFLEYSSTFDSVPWSPLLLDTGNIWSSQVLISMAIWLNYQPNSVPSLASKCKNSWLTNQVWIGMLLFPLVSSPCKSRSYQLISSFLCLRWCCPLSSCFQQRRHSKYVLQLVFCKISKDYYW